MQRTIKERCGNWEGYFESLRSYIPVQKALWAGPHPGLQKSCGRSTAVFSLIACTIKGGELLLPRQDKKRRCRISLPVKGFSHASKDKLIEARIVLYYSSYQVQVITDDGTPAGVMTLAPGHTNFVAIADNRGQKQGTRRGYMNNQPFVQVPYAQFKATLAVTAVKY